MVWEKVDLIEGQQPTARHEAAFVEVDNDFFLIGGRGKRPVSCFEPWMKSWIDGTEPPIELHHF